MAFFVVNNHYVFVPSSKYSSIREIVCRDKDPVWCFSASIFHPGGDNKAMEELADLIEQYLISFAQTNPKIFYEEWVHFDLQGEEAAQNVTDLLAHYGTIYGRSYLEDKREVWEQFCDLKPSIYARGDVFDFCFVKPLKKKKFSLMQNEKIEDILHISIEPGLVTRLAGHLFDFQIYIKECSVWLTDCSIQMQNCVIRFNQKVSLRSGVS